MKTSPAPSQINLAVSDLSRSIELYRLLGWPVGEPTGPHVAVDFGTGLTVELDQYEFAQQWAQRHAAVERRQFGAVGCRRRT